MIDFYSGLYHFIKIKQNKKQMFTFTSRQVQALIVSRLLPGDLITDIPSLPEVPGVSRILIAAP